MKSNGAPVIGKFLAKDEVVDVGSAVEFSSFTATVTRCILSPPGASSQIKKLISSSGGNASSMVISKSWKITYSTVRDLDRGRMKSYDGSLVLSIKDNWLVLKNAKGAQIGCKYKETNDSFSIGAKLCFPIHVVRMGAPLRLASSSLAMSADNEVEDVLLNSFEESGATSSGTPNFELVETLNGDATDNNLGSVDEPDLSLEPQSSPVAMSVHTSLSLGFSFSHGINFAKDVKSKFLADVHPSKESRHFVMVVSFGRATFKLDEDVVSIALESVIGGYCGELKVSLLRDRVFSFCVSCKDVGFHILKLRKFSCAQFKCFFSLWGRGGPNWRREFSLWQKEVESEWILVSPSKKIMQHGLSALKHKAGRSILSSARPSCKRLTFADSLSYQACIGYQDPVVRKKSGVIFPDSFVTDSLPRIVFGAVKPFPFSQRPSSDQRESVLVLNGSHTSSATQLDSNLLESPPAPVAQSSAQVDFSTPEAQLAHDDFNRMLDDMVYKVWSCGRCLSMGHSTRACTNDIRCRSCFSYGHIKKHCLGKRILSSMKWVPKKAVNNSIQLSESEVSLDEGAAFSMKWVPKNYLVVPPSPEMAVFEVDPLSMMDGVQEAGSISDDPSASTPDDAYLSEVEEVADHVVNVAPMGDNMLFRAPGPSIHLGADFQGVSMFDAGSRSTSVMLVGDSSGFGNAHVQPGLLSGKHLLDCFFFLGNVIYSTRKCIAGGDPLSVQVVPQLGSVSDGVASEFQFGIVFKCVFADAFLKKAVLGKACIDSALKTSVMNFMFPRKRAWAEVFKGFFLDDSGELSWPDLRGELNMYNLEDLGFMEFGPSDPAESGSFDSACLNSECVVVEAVPRRRGHPRKVDAPEVDSVLKRSTRSHRDGYNYQMLPYQPSRRKVSKVSVARAPEVLQIQEMQRIGVEECQIDPAVLTVERLLMGRDAQEAQK